MLGKVVDRNVALDGMNIVLWSHEADDGYTIMCYPKAKVYMEYFIKRGEPFCCCLNNFPKGNALDVWEGLISGSLTLRDCWKYFQEPSRDAFYLGWIENPKWNNEEWEMWKAEVDAQ